MTALHRSSLVPLAFLLLASPCLAASHGNPGFLESLAICFTVVAAWTFFIFMACLIPLIVFLVKVVMIAFGVWLLIKLLDR